MVAPENVFLDAITTHSDSDAVPIDAVIAWFDNVKKVPRLKQRTMAVVPAIERPLVAGEKKLGSLFSSMDPIASGSLGAQGVRLPRMRGGREGLGTLVFSFHDLILVPCVCAPR